MKTTPSNFRALLQIGSPAFRWNWRKTPHWFDDVSSSTHPDTEEADPAASLRPKAAALSCTTPWLVAIIPECGFDWTLTDDLLSDSI